MAQGKRYKPGGYLFLLMRKTFCAKRPFDREYLTLLKPLLFTVVDFGLKPRIASERSDSGEERIKKIKELIRESSFESSAKDEGFTKKDIDEMPVTEFIYFIRSWIDGNP